MRSPNKRSRSKSNRPKTLGNIVNRVFDSSGPEGKVRGTPQQIIEKYQVLARDAQLANDRVAAENFQQHAEHYTRMLAQAQREQAAEQEARRQQHEERNRQQQEERNRQQQARDQAAADENKAAPRDDQQPDTAAHQPAQGEAGADLVETPENNAEAQPAPQPRKTRKQADTGDATGQDNAAQGNDAQTDANQSAAE
jgi:hypothetical protein